MQHLPIIVVYNIFLFSSEAGCDNIITLYKVVATAQQAGYQDILLARWSSPGSPHPGFEYRNPG
jgi:hypothetical protein